MVRLLPGEGVTGWLNNHRIESSVTVLAIGASSGYGHDMSLALVQKLAEASRDQWVSKKDQKEFLSDVCCRSWWRPCFPSPGPGIPNPRPLTARSHGGLYAPASL
jgi:hypothetical protein